MTIAHGGWEYPPGAKIHDLREDLEDHMAMVAGAMRRELTDDYLADIRASGFRVSVTITPGPFESKV